jgi:UDPglucose--hexose-1-phosphate uridylyltransferase
MQRTPIVLADGRQLIYFDERPASRAASDQRELPAQATPAELRFDPLTGEWVGIAAHRQSRTYFPPSDECPLCPSSRDFKTEIPAADYDVVVFENRFPSFAGPTGRCEVVCFSPEHEASFKDLSVDRVGTVLAALADRTAELSRLPQVKQVFCFENRGPEIGVTLAHPHGQIYAYPYITPVTGAYLRLAEESGSNLYGELLATERQSERVVAANDHWTAFVPYAARWPYEIHLAPHEHTADLTGLSAAQREAAAPIWLDVTRRLDAVFGLPMPYIAAWHQAPVHTGRDLSWLHLRITSSRRAPGKLKYLAGSESAMGAWVNDVPPEQAAAALRAVTL